MSKAQSEMFGLAFVVVLLVVAMLFYVTLSSNSSTGLELAIVEADLYGKALETAMLETTISSCEYSLSTALRRCTTSLVLCAGEDVCEAAFTAWDTMLTRTLGDQQSASARDYRAYVLLEGQLLSKNDITFLKEPFPQTCSEKSNLYAAPRQPIHTQGGTLEFVVEFCG